MTSHLFLVCRQVHVNQSGLQQGRAYPARASVGMNSVHALNGSRMRLCRAATGCGQ